MKQKTQGGEKKNYKREQKNAKKKRSKTLS